MCINWLHKLFHNGCEKAHCLRIMPTRWQRIKSQSLSHKGESKSDLPANAVLLSHPSKPVPMAAPLQTEQQMQAVQCLASQAWTPGFQVPMGLESPPPWSQANPERWGYMCERKKSHLTGETRIKKEKKKQTRASWAFGKCLPTRGGQNSLLHPMPRVDTE